MKDALETICKSAMVYFTVALFQIILIKTAYRGFISIFGNDILLCGIVLGIFIFIGIAFTVYVLSVTIGLVKLDIKMEKIEKEREE